MNLSTKDKKRKTNKKIKDITKNLHIRFMVRVDITCGNFKKKD